MSVLRLLLVDDEPLALRRLATTLRAFDVEIVGSTTSARQAVRLTMELQPDVLFLAAHQDFAVRAFDVEAVDYLLKPVAPDRIEQSLARSRQWLSGRETNDGGHAPSAEPGGNPASLWSSHYREMRRIDLDAVEWFEADGDYVRVHMPSGVQLIRTTLSYLESRLDQTVFIRVHRSAICRRAMIVCIRRKPTGAMAADLASGDEAPVGRKFGGGLRAIVRQMNS
jgi:DNA-binding LytR/AlgR family response regulator